MNDNECFSLLGTEDNVLKAYKLLRYLYDERNKNNLYT